MRGKSRKVLDISEDVVIALPYPIMQSGSLVRSDYLVVGVGSMLFVHTSLGK